MYPRFLTILRHAKAEPVSDSGRDMDRPLAAKGYRQLARVYHLLTATKKAPDWIVASPALRVRQTAERVAELIGYTNHINWNDRIYAATPSTLLSVLQSTPDSSHHVLLIGHNPGMASLVSALCTGAAGSMNLRFPTASMAHFELQIVRWRHLRWDGSELRFLIAPRFLKYIQA